MNKEKELFEQYICTYCINCKSGKCYAPIKRCKGCCKIIQCVNFRKKNIQKEKYSTYIRYTYYDENGLYIAIVKSNTPTKMIRKFKSVYDCVKYRE